MAYFQSLSEELVASFVSVKTRVNKILFIALLTYLHSSPLVRSSFCPMKIAYRSGLTSKVNFRMVYSVALLM